MRRTATLLTALTLTVVVAGVAVAWPPPSVEGTCEGWLVTETASHEDWVGTAWWSIDGAGQYDRGVTVLIEDVVSLERVFVVTWHSEDGTQRDRQTKTGTRDLTECTPPTTTTTTTSTTTSTVPPTTTTSTTEPPPTTTTTTSSTTSTTTTTTTPPTTTSSTTTVPPTTTTTTTTTTTSTVPPETTTTVPPATTTTPPPPPCDGTPATGCLPDTGTGTALLAVTGTGLLLLGTALLWPTLRRRRYRGRSW